MNGMIEESSVCNGDDDDHTFDGVVTTSLRDAAESILTKSYAVYQLPQEHTNALSEAWNEARIFFSESSQQASMPSCRRRVVVGGNLLGYNELPAKKLFRAICSPWGDEHDQPWPPSCNLKSLSKDLAQKFHNVLIDCLHEICHQLLRNYEFLSTTSTKKCNDKDENKICRKNSIIPDLHEQRAHKRIKTPQHSDAHGDIFCHDRSQPQQQMLKMIIPKTFEESIYCPLDYFLYKNNDTNNIENCSAHVDRGILICVSLTDVAGLEVLERGGAWECPELISQYSNLYRERQSTNGLICILAGQELQHACQSIIQYNMSCTEYGKNSLIQDAHEKLLQACVHRVRKKLQRARLSVSYELRTNPDSR